MSNTTSEISWKININEPRSNMARPINHDEDVCQFRFKFRTELSAVQAIAQTLKPDCEGVSGVRAGLACARSSRTLLPSQALEIAPYDQIPPLRQSAHETTTSTGYQRHIGNHEDLRRHLLRSQDLSRQGKRTSPSLHPSRRRTLGGPWRHMRGMHGKMNGGPPTRIIPGRYTLLLE